MKAGGIIRRFNLDYYVNTADGSIFIEKKMGFFDPAMSGYATSSTGEIDGTIVFPNGQSTLYVYDAKHSRKRALNIESNRSVNETSLDNYTRMMQFLNSLSETSMHPDPLPETVIWSGPTQGYMGTVYNDEGDEVKMTMYFDSQYSRTIKTNQPIIGFMIGVVKDYTIKRCNRLAVFTKMDVPSKNYYMQAGLLSIKKISKTFDASSYKSGTMGGMTGSGAKNKMEQFIERYKEISLRMGALKEGIDRCDDDPSGRTYEECREHYERLIEEAEMDGKILECEIAKYSGTEDLLDFECD